VTIFQDSLPIAPVFPLLSERTIKELESELVAALYAQRSVEDRLLSCEPQTSAPAELQKQLVESKRCVHGIELKIRRLRHSF
jgi:hypothetical protein